MSIPAGNEKLLKDLCVRQKESFSLADSRGWTPLHEAASQSNQSILELMYKGLCQLQCFCVDVW